MTAGQSLKKTGNNIVTDENNLFSSLDKNNILIIQDPVSAAGTYKISDISSDYKSLILHLPCPLADFNNGNYKVLNVIDYRTGFQNGFFVLEQSKSVGQPYFLNQGYYEFEYNHSNYYIYKTNNNHLFDPHI